MLILNLKKKRILSLADYEGTSIMIKNIMILHNKYLMFNVISLPRSVLNSVVNIN